MHLVQFADSSMMDVGRFFVQNIPNFNYHLLFEFPVLQAVKMHQVFFVMVNYLYVLFVMTNSKI